MTEVDIRFRPLSRDDLPQFREWLRDPDVSRWWQTPIPEGVEAEYGRSIDGDDPTEVFVVIVDGRDAGIIQRFRMDDEPEWLEILGAAGVPMHHLERAAGIDYLLGEAWARGRGVGTEMIRRFTAMTFDEWTDCERILTSVQQANRPSWRALERAGYGRVWEGVLDSPDPSDSGPAFALVVPRPTATAAAPAP